MRNTAVSRCHRRGLRGYTVLAGATTLTAMTAVLATFGPPAQAALTHWPGASTPDTISPDTNLKAVSADSATDACAAGFYDNSAGTFVPFTTHWNGTAWKQVTAPTPISAAISGLNAVSAVSASDAWAAGQYENSSGEVALIEHWNGTAWKLVKSPVPSGTTSSQLLGVSADSASDAWAAGWFTNSSGQVALIEHWNGTAWNRVKSPALPSGAFEPQLNGVSAVSASDAWAAGWFFKSNSGGGSTVVPLIEHWNGTAWKLVKRPVPSGATSTQLNGVSADSASDAWAAGWFTNSSAVNVPLIEHWNGTAWKLVKRPVPSGATNTQLNGVSADSASDAWAAGWFTNSSAVNVPLIEHWNGTAWKRVAAPVPSGATNTQLNGVSAYSPTDAWAAGQYESSSGVYESLILHWNGTAWKQVTSPNGP